MMSTTQRSQNGKAEESGLYSGSTYGSMTSSLAVAPPAFAPAAEPIASPAGSGKDEKRKGPDDFGTGKNMFNPAAEFRNTNLHDIIQASTLADPNPAEQNRKIVEEFNRGNKADISVESVLWGKRIDQDEFRLVHRNNVPQLMPYTYYPRRLGIYATGTTEEIGVYKQTDLCIGSHGRYVVNVPQGKIVKAWLGNNTPILLGAGPHVIRHPNFRLEENPAVSLAEPYISHGNYKIIRVPRGMVAKIWIGSTPHILESSPEPYVFNDPTFRIETTSVNGRNVYFTDTKEKLITHGSIKRVMPQVNEVGIAYDSGKLCIIEPTNEPYTRDDPTFIVDGFLQTAAQTLVFPSKKTQEERRKANPEDADSINYEEFRTSDGLPIGVNLLVVYEIFDPKITLTRLKKDDIMNHIENIVVADMGRVIQSCSSSDFQKTNQTAVKDPTKMDNMAIFQTQSAPTFYAHLQDDVKNKLAEDLREWGIRLVRLNIETPKILDKTIADEMAKNSLGAAKTRAEASTLSLDYTIKQQRAAQEAEKKRIEMERDKENKIIQAQGDAQSITIRAQADLDAAKLKAEAERITYENNIKREQMVNETAVRRIQMENDAKLKLMQSQFDLELGFLEKRAKVYGQNEAFRQYETAKAQAEALRGISTSVISPEVAQSWYSAAQGVGFFSPLRSMPPAVRLDGPAAAAAAPKEAEQHAQPKLAALK